MSAESANHTPALFVENSGFQFNGYPSLGGWLSYGLGSLTEDLPAYVVLPDGRSEPNGGATNWSNGFLPAEHQGTLFDMSRPEPVSHLVTPATVKPDARLAGLKLVREMNSKRVTVYGQVQRPGTFPYSNPMTLSQAISLAGGFTAMAQREKVRVSRVENERQEVLEVDLREIAEGKAPNRFLSPGDEVYVPERLF